jgi:CRP/FNR family transcriptional regulator, anaerobic regulatory protein
MKVYSNDNHLSDWKKYISSFNRKKFFRGEMILMEGEVPEFIYLITEGSVRTFSIDSEGEEHPVSFDTKDEIFPIGWALDLIKETQFLYQAFTDCEVVLIPREDFCNYIKGNPKIGYELYETLAGRLIGLQARIHALQQKLSKDKIILTLLYMADRFGTKLNNKKGQSLIEIPLTHQELSSFIGLTRETTSIELKKLSNLGVIAYKVDVEALKKLSESN